MERKVRTMNNRTKAAQQALEQITQLIEEQGGIVKKEQFTELGIDYRRILDFVQSGDLVRIKNGYYTDRIDRFTEEELVARLFGDTRLCMESALYAYGYISQKPYGWHLAVDKNTSKSRFKMDYPKIIPYYTVFLSGFYADALLLAGKETAGRYVPGAGSVGTRIDGDYDQRAAVSDL